jgi:hypothetical protein
MNKRDPYIILSLLAVGWLIAKVRGLILPTA